MRQSLCVGKILGFAVAAAAPLFVSPSYGFPIIPQFYGFKDLRNAVSVKQSSRSFEDLLHVESSTPSSRPDVASYFTDTSVSAKSNGGVIQRFDWFQSFARAMPVATSAFYLVNPQPLDDAISVLWAAIYNWPVAQNPLFEAEVASFGFFWAIASFSSLHIILGPEKTREYRLDGELPNDPLSWTRRENWHLWFNPLASYLGSIWLYHQIHEKAPLPEIAPSFGVLVVEILFGVWLYDLCFYPIHYFMHKSKLGNIRRVHGYHHRWSSQGSLNSLETVQHSYLDGFLQVAVNILVQQISPFGGAKHTMSRICHNLIVTYLLSEAHSGYDLSWMSHNIYPEILGGSPRHDRHHHNGKVYYHQYFKYLDDVLGFVDKENMTDFNQLEIDKVQANAPPTDSDLSIRLSKNMEQP